MLPNAAFKQWQKDQHAYAVWEDNNEWYKWVKDTDEIIHAILITILEGTALSIYQNAAKLARQSDDQETMLFRSRAGIVDLYKKYYGINSESLTEILEQATTFYLPTNGSDPREQISHFRTSLNECAKNDIPYSPPHISAVIMRACRMNPLYKEVHKDLIKTDINMHAPEDMINVINNW
jgi:hypothetical protein